jgi:hypothetical protein
MATKHRDIEDEDRVDLGSTASDRDIGQRKTWSSYHEQ